MKRESLAPGRIPTDSSRVPGGQRNALLLVQLLVLAAAVCLSSAADPQTTSIGTRSGGSDSDAPVGLPGAPDSVDAAAADNPRLWFVEFATPPTIEGGQLSDVLQDKEQFRTNVRQHGLPLNERLAFDVLWNGISVEIDPENLGKLSRIPGVVALYPIESIVAEVRTESVITLSSALPMTRADVAQNELGLDGTGVRVGIIDTGVDYDHPDLGGCFGPGCRVEFGWDFVGDEYTGASSPIVPDPDPDDCHGHGTHVAGIVGARGAVTGVAPNVTFGAYRVFGCEGRTTSDVMIAAMEQALEDGMNVVNMSIGSARQWPQYPTAMAGTRLVNAGVVVTASFGNGASAGLYGGSAPAMGDKVIGVASINNTHFMLPTFEVAGRDIAYDRMTYAAEPPTFGSEPMVYMGRGCSGDPMYNHPAGRVALIERGGCTFREKATIAMANRARGAVIFNNEYGVVFGTLSPPQTTWNVVGISRQDGLYLRSLVDPWITWTDRLSPGSLSAGGLISSFSSHGVSPDLQLKPDLAAPGAFIYGTYPLEKGGNAILSGTSMSAPHVAGAAALLLEARPNTPTQAVGEILQNSSVPIANRQGFEGGLPECVHRQGAGIIDIVNSVTADLKITPGKLSLGESEHGPVVRTLTIENRSEQPVTYALTHEPALATSGIIDLTYQTAEASASFQPSAITVPPNGNTTVTVTIEAPVATHGVQYGGYVVLAESGGERAYRVPYSGFVGDYQAIRVLSDTPQGFPWLAKKIFGRYYNRPNGATYTMQGDDRPFFLVHLDHQVRKLRLEVYDAVTGRSWHRASEFDYFPRNVQHISWWLLGWDGFTRHGNSVEEVPNGSYRIRLDVQKALGDDDDPDHWESWTSPIVRILRPGPGESREVVTAGGTEGLTSLQQLGSSSTEDGPR